MSSHTTEELTPLNVAVLTVSDTRTEENDTSGQVLVEKLIRPKCGKGCQEDEDAEKNVTGWITEVTDEVPFHDRECGPLGPRQQHHDCDQNQQKEQVVEQ